MVCIGMFLCAYIIDQTTHETRYKKNAKVASRMYWIQPGGQKLGDQVFESFIGVSNRGNNTYIKSERVNKPKLEVTLWIAVGTTMSAFVVQFVGLRAAHPSIILAQLGATLIMALLRAMLRSRRMDQDNDLIASHAANIERYPPKLREILQGNELEFLALHILSDLPKDTPMEPTSSKIWMSMWRNIMCKNASREVVPEDTSIKIVQDSINIKLQWEEEGRGSIPKFDLLQQAFETRVKFARLTGQKFGLHWTGVRARPFAEHLALAIEGVMNALMEIEPGKLGDLKYTWPVSVQYSHHDQSSEAPKPHDSIFNILTTREHSVAWKTQLSELESLLGLWQWSIYLRVSNSLKDCAEVYPNLRWILLSDGEPHEEYYQSDEEDDAGDDVEDYAEDSTEDDLEDDLYGVENHQMRFKDKPNKVSKRDWIYKMWIQRRLQPLETEIIPPLDTCVTFGYSHLSNREKSPSDFVVVETENDIPKMCAQDLFMAFLDYIMHHMARIQRGTRTRPESFGQSRLLLQNNSIEKIADAFEKSELGSREDAYMCIIPVFVNQNIMPTPEDILLDISSEAQKLRNENRWQDAEQLIEQIIQEVTVFSRNGLAPALTMLGDLYHDALISPNRAVHYLAYSGVPKLAALCSPGYPTIFEQYISIYCQIAEDQKDPNYDFWTKEFRFSPIGPELEAFELARGNSSRRRGYFGNLSQVSVACARYVLKRDKIDVNNLQWDADGRSLLVSALKAKNIDLALLVLRAGIDVTVADHYGTTETPLAYAVQLGFGDIAKKIIECNPSVLNSLSRVASHSLPKGTTKAAARQFQFPVTPLLVATIFQQKECLSTLLKSPGIDVEWRNSNDYCVFSLAILNGDAGMAEHIFNSSNADRKAALTGTTSGASCCSLLHMAAQCEYEKEAEIGLVQFLMKIGISVNVTDVDGSTPLHYAIRQGNDQMAKTLLSQGADPDLRENHGETPLSLSFKNRHDFLEKYMLRLRSNWPGTIRATCLQGDKYSFRILLDAGVDIDFSARDLRGERVLENAIRGGNVGIVKAILQMMKPGDIDITNPGNEGMTALHLAYQKNRMDVVPLLIEKGARTDIADENGITAADMAGKLANEGGKSDNNEEQVDET
ncbi:Ankyrin-2 [Dactylella cylindrospora]|nr:Ankyrin-2 [Dactylella cylindrospora]